mgnify:CR=1 FL=1
MHAKGSLGESLAEQFLIARGFRVIGRNVRAGRREILLQNAGSMGPEAKAVTQCI